MNADRSTYTKDGLREAVGSGSKRIAAWNAPGLMNFSSGRARLAPQVSKQEGRLGWKPKCQPRVCAQSLLLGAPSPSPGSLGIFHSGFEERWFFLLTWNCWVTGEGCPRLKARQQQLKSHQWASKCLIISSGSNFGLHEIRRCEEKAGRTIHSRKNELQGKPPAKEHLLTSPVTLP